MANKKVVVGILLTVCVVAAAGVSFMKMNKGADDAVVDVENDVVANNANDGAPIFLTGRLKNGSSNAVINVSSMPKTLAIVGAATLTVTAGCLFYWFVVRRSPDMYKMFESGKVEVVKDDIDLGRRPKFELPKEYAKDDLAVLGRSAPTKAEIKKWKNEYKSKLVVKDDFDLGSRPKFELPKEYANDDLAVLGRSAPTKAEIKKWKSQ